MRLAACNFLPFLLSFSILLSGCAPKTTAPPNSVAGMPLSGGVHGGQQPVVGAHVYLFAAGTTGYGAASTSLLTSGTVGSDSLGQFVTTDASGSFTITGDYTCASGTQLYVLATQGNPGLPDGQVNPNLALMAAVGQCPAANNIQTTVPFIWVNEVTTIASVYAVSGFMTDLVHVSSSGTTLAQAEIAQAFAAVNNLVNIATGNALATTPAGNGTVPQAEIKLASQHHRQLRQLEWRIFHALHYALCKRAKRRYASHRYRNRGALHCAKPSYERLQHLRNSTSDLALLACALQRAQ